jgi:sulfofructose kinase
MAKPKIDVVGLGLNAVDTIVRVPKYPVLGSKARILHSVTQAGGQIATALVTCHRLGLSTRYIGKVGDDAAGRMQLASLRREGVEVRHVRTSRRTPNQLAYILVDEKTGERTVLWDRDPRLAVSPSDFDRRAVSTARVLLLDGCDVEACSQAARWAKAAGIPVVADLDTVYKNVERLLPLIDYLIASADFLPALTGKTDPFRALEHMARKFRVTGPGVTLGGDGALLYEQGRFHYSPGFVVRAVDTTGAGDVFHGAFIYGLLSGWSINRMVAFSNAMAALNCTALGARGGIATRAKAEKLMASAPRHSNPAYKTSTHGRLDGSFASSKPGLRKKRVGQ